MSPQYSSAVAYFHWPPVWFVKQPEHIDTSADLNIVVYRAKLQSNINVIVQQNGIIIFEFLGPSEGYIDPSTNIPASDEEMKSIENAIYWRTQLMNTHLICLYYALGKLQQGRHLKKMVVTPSSLLQYTDNSLSGAHNSSTIAEMHFMKCPDALPSDFAWWHEKRELTIEEATLDLSFQMLTSILNHKEKDTLQLVLLYARSSSSYEEHDFNLSLITAWAVIERLIQVLWSGYIEVNRERPSGQTFINKKRKERLEDHRQYTVASIVEILSLTNTIPMSLYEEINEIRVARNHWMHGLETITQLQSQNAIRLASEMLRLIYSIELPVPLGLMLRL